MSGFSRTFKPNSYLTSWGGRRPRMPGRTLSNSSEASNRSGGGAEDDDELDRPRHSRATTPTSEVFGRHLDGPPVAGTIESHQPPRYQASHKSPFLSPHTSYQTAAVGRIIRIQAGPTFRRASSCPRDGRCLAHTFVSSRQRRGTSGEKPKKPKNPYIHLINIRRRQVLCTIRRTEDWTSRQLTDWPNAFVCRLKTAARSARFNNRSSNNSSRPINIELPQVRKFNSAPLPTPSAPLSSARGDLPGGYFPFHEETRSKIQQPPDLSNASGNASRQPATTATTNIVTDSSTTTTSATATTSQQSHQSHQHQQHLHPHDRHHQLRPTTMSVTRSDLNTPVTSYIPIGVHDTALPMGKYYPSNYESRMSRTQPPMRHNSSTSTISSTRSSQMQQAQQHQNPQHQQHQSQQGQAQSSQPNQHYQQQPQQRPELDVKTRLQQYQRDMIAQTRMVASDAVGSASAASAAAGRTSSTATTPSTSGPRNHFPFGSTMLIGATMMSTPISPRLHPLGSPGPVTPMDLEESNGDYLSKGQTTPGVDPAGFGRLGQQRHKR